MSMGVSTLHVSNIKGFAGDTDRSVLVSRNPAVNGRAGYLGDGPLGELAVSVSANHRAGHHHFTRLARPPLLWK